MSTTYEELRTRLAEIADLSRVIGLLFWDQRTMMPPTAAPARAEQLATLNRITHERFVSEEIGRLLEEARPEEESLEYESVEASHIRVARRDYEKARRVPPELRAEMVRTAALALPAWEQARRTSDFSAFLPHLERTLELRRKYVACFDKADEDYDILLDDYEPGMKTAEVRAVFDILKRELTPLVAAVAEHAEAVDDSCLAGPFPAAGQKAFEMKVLDAFGFTPESWRIDETVHPFASNGGIGDIRLTTRYREHELSVFASMHEFGHGLYEHGIAPELERTLLCRGVSLGLHESQSRMWENLVGRSRPFWRHFFPALRQEFPSLAGVDAEGFYRAVNKIESSPVRIEADEVTYNMHIILRFELGQELLAGSLAPADVPEAWNAKMAGYLGIEVPDIADGVLQDMHWAGGHVGYFSTYTLGNVISIQIWERLKLDLPDVDGRIEAGDFAALREWLREHLHRLGRMFTPKETLERVVGGPLDPGPYVAYLKAKADDLYGLSA